MIRRAFDAALLNEIVNDPIVRPTVGGDGPLDCTALVTDRRNVALVGEGGGAMFAWRGPGVFEGHSFFRVRGRPAIALGRAMLAKMHKVYAADLIWGITPIELRHVRWFNRKLGFVSRGEVKTPEGIGELFEMRF